MGIFDNLSAFDPNNLPSDVAAQVNAAVQGSSTVDVAALMTTLNTALAAAKVTATGKDVGAELKKLYDKAVSDYVFAPEEVQLTEKNLYVYEHRNDSGGGDPAYTAMLTARYTETATGLSATISALHQDYLSDIRVLITQYANATTMANRVTQLETQRQKELTLLLKQIAATKSDVATQNRLVSYEDKDRAGLQQGRVALYVVYYTILILYILFGDFARNQSKVLYVLIGIYVAFPLLLNWLVRAAFRLVHSLKRLFEAIPNQNAYVNLG